MYLKILGLALVLAFVLIYFFHSPINDAISWGKTIISKIVEPVEANSVNSTGDYSQANTPVIDLTEGS